jgi:hypothetical protein
MWCVSCGISFECQSVQKPCVLDVQKDFSNWYQKMAAMFPQPTTDAAAGADVTVPSGVLPKGTSKPVLGSTGAVHSVGSTLVHNSASTGTSQQYTPLATVPEHQAVSKFSPSSTAIALEGFAALQAQDQTNSTSSSSYHNIQEVSSSTRHMHDSQNMSMQTAHKGDVGSSAGTSGVRIMGVPLPTVAPIGSELARAVGIGVSGIGSPGLCLRTGTVGNADKLSSVGMSNGGKYPTEVLEAAQPYLTGDAVADEDILGFYMARHAMIHGGGWLWFAVCRVHLPLQILIFLSRNYRTALLVWNRGDLGWLFEMVHWKHW